ncbi:uncharacterized protein I303_104797 [Kwoniella dejecticola CBS 10117]|uniref:MICOS complex subunit MIC60 n=1 Tax=Kwoniella dejecticola CBS 10117 TaxID=1296121 RepID=A0A1A6A4A9_9TREE|nr:mitochondrial protein [Kwoniella dejecticola CBS 10117]OBR84900.1 mitochondrial protein [Kwoniella dejecticola CBS 10117]
MYGQLRVARSRAVRSLPQRRCLATPPSTPPGGTTLPPNPPTTLNSVPTRPVTVPPTTPTPGSSTLAAPVKPLPPPSSVPPPRKPRKFFRRFIIYTTLGAVTFYGLSGFVSTKSEGYRDFFVGTFPGAEAIADFADDHGWESFGFGSITKKAVQSYKSATGTEPTTTTQKIEKKAAEAKKDVIGAAEKVKAKGVEAKDAITGKETTTQKIQHTASDLKDRAIAATHKAEDRIKHLAHDAKEKVDEVTKDVPFNFSDGVEGIVREAEKALGSAESSSKKALRSAENTLSNAERKVEDAAHDAKEAIKPHATAYEKAVSPYQQRTRELNPTGVQPQQPTFEGKRVYDGPPLPLGHEPPPGYYIPPPAKPVKAVVEEKVEKIKQTLPLLVPKVKEFASEEPIISQLASTIDSLTSSLSNASSTGLPSTDATGILSKAQDDLTALNKRLHDVKAAEKERLEKTVGEKTAEFESLLKGKEADWTKSEQGLKESWAKERETLVEKWRGELEGELESQRQGIEQRLRDEVVSQGIELQRRWLRSIKTQVETERGGRLAKLDNLTTSLKQLERVTIDNSAQLDDNVRLHKIWSALRAVQSKVEAGDVNFEEELKALKSLSATEGEEEQKGVIGITLEQLEKTGIPATGVKSFGSLSSWFSGNGGVSNKIHSSSLVPQPEEASVLSHLASAGLSKLLFRPSAGKVEGHNVGAVLARAEWCLAEKDLDGAAREVNSLKGWPGKLAGDWLREARRKLEVQQALEIVATEATLSSLLLA